MAEPTRAQPIEVRSFGVPGPGLADPPYLATPYIEPKHELSIPEDLSTNFVFVACALQWRQHAA